MFPDILQILPFDERERESLSMKKIAAGAIEEYLEKQNALNKDYFYL